ncbi:MAG: lipid-A-disaccharide synthase [Bacteroidales bacterium]|nr:lipid-A-disaccharide synthase [Bacteroidales bacterium]
MKYYLIAGEASGDLHASRLMQQLLAQDPEASFRYYGGEAMQAVGGQLVHHYSTMAYMGFVQVALHLDHILANMSECKKDIARFAPDALILVDYPGFNLSIAQWARRHMPSAKICYYISPKIWAWKSYRLKAIRRNVDLMLSILPFEVEWYRARDYIVTYVGNPTVDELAPLLSEEKALANEKYVLLVPGSRRAEVKDNLRVMLAATRGMGMRIIAGAPGLDPAFYAEVLEDCGCDMADVQVRFNQTHQLMRHAQVAAVTSGTATLEAASLDCPQVVCYNFKGGWTVYNVMKMALHSIRYVSLVNLLIYGVTGDRSLPDERHAAVCELLGPYLNERTLRDELQKIWADDSPARLDMLRQYAVMRQRLGGPGAPQRAASAIIEILH